MKKALFLIFSIALAVHSPNVFAQESGFAQDRLEVLKKKYSVKLDEATVEAVKKNCDSTKLSLRALQITTDTAVRKRLLVYTDIQKELKAIEVRLTRRGADASEVDLLIGKMQQQLDSFNQTSRAHSEIVSDLVAIDCKSNPDLFASGMYEIRWQREQLLENAKDLKSTVESTDESTFRPLIDRLIL